MNLLMAAVLVYVAASANPSYPTGFALAEPAAVAPTQYVITTTDGPIGEANMGRYATSWVLRSTVQPTDRIGVCTRGTTVDECDVGNGGGEGFEIASVIWPASPPSEPAPPQLPMNPTVEPEGNSWLVAWTPPESGPTPTSYVIETRDIATGWRVVAEVSSSPAQVTTTIQCQDFRVSSRVDESASTPTEPVCGELRKAVTAAATQLCIVSGSTTGMRAVYANTSTVSRGTRIGDLIVGPTTVTDFERIACSCSDRVTYGGIRYARVSEQALEGYVAGCVSVGTH